MITQQEELNKSNNNETTSYFPIQHNETLTSSNNDVSFTTITFRDIEAASAAVSELQNLFSNCVFYFSREVPRYSLEFIIRSFGGQVCWDSSLGGGSPFKENDERITHHICDRPTQGHVYFGRLYVQPQWVYDSINFRKLMRTETYEPGKTLPPHLSPFVEYKEGDYVPEEIHELQGKINGLKSTTDKDDMIVEVKRDEPVNNIISKVNVAPYYYFENFIILDISYLSYNNNFVVYYSSRQNTILMLINQNWKQKLRECRILNIKT